MKTEQCKKEDLEKKRKVKRLIMSILYDLTESQLDEVLFMVDEYREKLKN